MAFDPDLREISLGEWEGLTYAEVLERDPERAASWQADSRNVAPPGGETTYQFRDRLVRAYLRWRAAYPEASILWVTHGGAIGVILCYLLGMDLNRRWQFRRDNTAITELDIGTSSLDRNATDSHYAIVMRLNDTCHLLEILNSGSGEAEARQVL